MPMQSGPIFVGIRLCHTSKPKVALIALQMSYPKPPLFYVLFRLLWFLMKVYESQRRSFSSGSLVGPFPAPPPPPPPPPPYNPCVPYPARRNICAPLMYVILERSVIPESDTWPLTARISVRVRALPFFSSLYSSVVFLFYPCEAMILGPKTTRSPSEATTRNLLFPTALPPSLLYLKTMFSSLLECRSSLRSCLARRSNHISFHP